MSQVYISNIHNWWTLIMWVKHSISKRFLWNISYLISRKMRNTINSKGFCAKTFEICISKFSNFQVNEYKQVLCISGPSSADTLLDVIFDGKWQQIMPWQDDVRHSELSTGNTRLNVLEPRCVFGKIELAFLAVCNFIIKMTDRLPVWKCHLASHSADCQQNNSWHKHPGLPGYHLGTAVT
jgi:hypothetical protein